MTPCGKAVCQGLAIVLLAVLVIAISVAAHQSLSGGTQNTTSTTTTTTSKHIMKDYTNAMQCFIILTNETSLEIGLQIVDLFGN